MGYSPTLSLLDGSTPLYHATLNAKESSRFALSLLIAPVEAKVLQLQKKQTRLPPRRLRRERRRLRQTLPRRPQVPAHELIKYRRSKTIRSPNIAALRGAATATLLPASTFALSKKP